FEALKQVGGYNKLQKLEVINENAKVLYFQTAEIKISNPKFAPMHIDGDPVETVKDLEIELLHDCFQLILP
ncbi:MAG: diacylglycerol/lipid kinase family protein, partial [Flavisolibacter sp.]